MGIQTPRSSADPVLVKSAEISVGPYRALRLVLSGGLLEVVQLTGSTKSYATDGYDVTPSNGQLAGALILPDEALSGLDLELPADVTRGPQSFEIFLRFNAARSFSQDTSGVDRWMMHPQVTVEALPSPIPL